MTSLIENIRSLRRYPHGQPLNVTDMARYIGIHDGPISMRSVVSRISSIPDSMPFQAAIITGAAMGGELTLTLSRNGSYRFAGFMRATGLPSFSFQINAVVRSPNGEVTVAAQHSGKVFGTDTPGGKRQYDWDELGNDPDTMKAIREAWPLLTGAKIAVSRASELSGVTGAAVDIARAIAEFVILKPVTGVQLAVCIVVGSEAQRVGLTTPGLGGVVGLGIVAGSVIMFGPASIMQAMIVGVAVGTVVDSMVKVRTLHPPEIELADKVFGDSLDIGRIRVTNLSGIGGRAFAFPTIDKIVLVNVGDRPDFDQMHTAVTPNYPVPGQLLVHELTHAWQYQHAAIDDGYAPGQLCQGIVEQATLGKVAYSYGPAGQPWGSFRMEGQAAIVDDWFGGTAQGTKEVVRPAMDAESPYFGYISDKIRVGPP